MNSTWYCQKYLFHPQFDPESLHMCTKLSGRAAQFSRKEKFDEIVHFLSARWQSFQYRLWFRCREHLKMGECISEVKDQKALLLRVSFPSSINLIFVIFFTLTHFESWKFYKFAQNGNFLVFLEFFYTQPKILHSRRSWQISGMVMVLGVLSSWGDYLQVLRTQSRGGLADEDDVQENFEGWSKHRSSRQGGCQSMWSWSSDRQLYVIAIFHLTREGCWVLEWVR